MTKMRNAAAIGAGLLATACVSAVLAAPAQASHGGGWFRVAQEALRNAERVGAALAVRTAPGADLDDA